MSMYPSNPSRITASNRGTSGIHVLTFAARWIHESAFAAIGSSATVETIDRKQVEVQIPEGTEQDAVLTVPGEGVRKKGRSGDLRVRVKIRTPRHLSAEERDLYQKLLQLEGKKKPKRKGLFGHLRG